MLKYFQSKFSSLSEVKVRAHFCVDVEEEFPEQVKNPALKFLPSSNNKVPYLPTL